MNTEPYTAKLDRAGGDLSPLGPNLMATMIAFRFPDASLLWLNRRWFLEAEIEIDDPVVRISIERWLLSNFAATGPTEMEPIAQPSNDSVEMQCDRYGAPRGTVHGGSGRVGGSVHFQAKGIGRTPLAAKESDKDHWNGSLWLEAAVREAIWSEIIMAEFPHGAVPVIAIIDTGRALRWPDDVRGPYRAILVRPTAPRIAHLQRSIFFGEGGYKGSEQHNDALRVRDAWKWVDGYSQGSGFAIQHLRTCFERIGEQYGFAHAVRLWPGPFYSSNASIDGRLLDFDSMRSLPDWTRSSARINNINAGEEIVLIRECARSLSNLSEIYLDRRIMAEDLVWSYETGWMKGFNFAAENSIIDSDKKGFIRKYLSEKRGMKLSCPDCPYPTLNRNDLGFEKFVSRAMVYFDHLIPGDINNASIVGEFIRKSLTTNRRTWRHLPEGFRPRRQAADIDWLWLEGIDRNGDRMIVIQGILHNGIIKIADQVIEFDQSIQKLASRFGSWISIAIKPNPKNIIMFRNGSLCEPQGVCILPIS